MTRYYFTPTKSRLALGVLLFLIPPLGVWASDNFSAEELVSALAFYWSPAVLVVFGRRGLLFESERREFRVWYGLGFTRSLAWPVWRTRPKRFQFVMVRYKTSTHPNTPGSSLSVNSPVVWVVDEEDKWIAIGGAWTTLGAHKIAAAISGETGLPLRE